MSQDQDAVPKSLQALAFRFGLLCRSLNRLRLNDKRGEVKAKSQSNHSTAIASKPFPVGAVMPVNQTEPHKLSKVPP